MELTKNQIDQCVCPGQDAPFTALFQIACPEWKGENQINPSNFFVSPETWQYICTKFREVYGTEGVVHWTSSGFSSREYMPDWEVRDLDEIPDELDDEARREWHINHTGRVTCDGCQCEIHIDNAVKGDDDEYLCNVCAEEEGLL